LSEAAAKAQTFALQAQINPHFFFNTLNTISALVPIDPKAAQETIGRLADMFRYTLSCSRGACRAHSQAGAYAGGYTRGLLAIFYELAGYTIAERSVLGGDTSFKISPCFSGDSQRAAAHLG